MNGWTAVKNNSKRQYLSDRKNKILLSFVKRQADISRKRGASRAVIDELIILLLLKAGLRTGELCGLKIFAFSGKLDINWLCKKKK